MLIFPLEFAADASLKYKWVSARLCDASEAWAGMVLKMVSVSCCLDLLLLLSPVWLLHYFGGYFGDLVAILVPPVC
ncbi:hypothetical protein Nepgr_003993 [Nepenthes gracilis]|uniref:Uncharacterized protein n=1 Tax=Nepenthes gracilis TaxID=150966 RepID=A0AAD3S0N7_NEPGR|nr:hypothetical protein Nepgr_003993 [Nepenthes gracilis]